MHVRSCVTSGAYSEQSSFYHMEIPQNHSQFLGQKTGEIYTIRGHQVMLDLDLAEIYGYTTKAFNQQIRNNIDRFPDDFRFQLTKEEIDSILRSKNLTSTWGGLRYLPYAFTEQGIYMLMTVLKGNLAERQSVAIMRAFKSMREYIFQNKQLFF